jgi:carboxymethylenebutenolidase
MAILTETISEPGFSGYLARPERAAGPLPGLIVIQEAWGVDAHIEDVTRRFAAAGYLALAPDLFAEGAERPPPFARERMAELQAFMNAAPPTVFSDAGAREAALAKLPEPERTRVGESLGALTSVMAPARREGLLAIVQAAGRYLREVRPETRGPKAQGKGNGNGKIGAIGFCLGGGLSALFACRDPELGAAVVFYGVPPAAEEIPKIQCPVMFLFGKADQRIAATVPAFAEAMSAAGKRLERLAYEGAGHAFFNDGRPTYDVAAARDAFARVLAFLGDALV